MGISGIRSGLSANLPSGSDEAKIQALEQKLQQLYKQKEQALKANDAEKAKKLDEQIQEIKKQLALLRQKDGKEQEKSRENSNSGRPGCGRYLDETI